ncbi:MAG: hypothetical protein CMJ52_11050 [Planctomycetaceae bacterium]|nr:hypothetical protein [Planctomycetaceae bacterium]
MVRTEGHRIAPFQPGVQRGADAGSDSLGRPPAGWESDRSAGFGHPFIAGTRDLGFGSGLETRMEGFDSSPIRGGEWRPDHGIRDFPHARVDGRTSDATLSRPSERTDHGPIV